MTIIHYWMPRFDQNIKVTIRIKKKEILIPKIEYKIEVLNL
jgi:hypothetical protein